MSGAPGRSVTTDAASCPLRDRVADVWSGIWPNAPATRGAFCPSSDTNDPPINACRPAAAPASAPGIGGRHVGGVPTLGEPVVERRAVRIDDVRTVDSRPVQRPNELGRKQLPAVRVGGREAVELDARPAVAASDAGLAAVGARDGTSQSQRRTEQVAHGVGHLRSRAGNQFAHQFGRQLVGVGHRDVPRVGHHGLAGGVDEVQGVALVGRLELLPVQEHSVGQPIDAPAARRLDQVDGARVGQAHPRPSRTRPCRTASRGCRPSSSPKPGPGHGFRRRRRGR